MTNKECFRPLTGTLLSKHETFAFQERNLFVSVPSRGLSYLNDMLKSGVFERVTSFRPLTGTLLSKSLRFNYYGLARKGFRPLTGTLLSK